MLEILPVLRDDEQLAVAMKLGHAIGGAVALGAGLLQLLLLLRQRTPRERELAIVAAVLLSSVPAWLAWAQLEFDGYRGWAGLRAAIVPLAATAWLVALAGPGARRAVVSAGVACLALVVVDVVGVPGVGWATSSPSPTAGALAHVVVVVAAVVTGTLAARSVAAADEPDLRVLVVGAWLIVPLLLLQTLTAAGVLWAPDVSGTAAVVWALATSAWRFERSSRLLRQQVASDLQQAQAQAQAPPPTTTTLELGGYRLLQRLGQGGMAEVYLAERTGPEGFAKRVALKKMLPEVVSDETFRTMFLDEARLAARLEHENVIRIHELGKDGDRLFLVMQLVEGLALSQLWRRGSTLEPDVVVAIGAQLLAGLAYAHELKDEFGQPLHIVHRDISPHNLMVDGDGVVRILDFGIARAAGRSTKTETGALKGKIPYMAPEQLGGVVDARTDLYAAGVVLCELACGRRPVTGDDAAMLGALVRREIAPPVELGGVPATLRKLIVRALSPLPEDRPASARQMRDELLASTGVDVDVARRKLAALVQQALLQRAPAPPPRKTAATVVDGRRARQDDDDDRTVEVLPRTRSMKRDDAG